MKRLMILAFLSIGLLSSCQIIMRHYLGIKDPGIEKARTVSSLMVKNEIANAHFIKKEKIVDAYIGTFPKIIIYDKNGYQVMLPNCYEMIEVNLYRLADTVSKELSPLPSRDKFVQETIQSDNTELYPEGKYDYEVFFYWSVWLGKFNIKKLRTAQNTIATINQIPNQKKLILIPVNFDFIEESGWTKMSVDTAMARIVEYQKKK
jgi:hypothetical protein